MLICSYCRSRAFRRFTPLFCVPHNVFSSQHKCKENGTPVGRGPRGIAFVDEACRSASNFCRARDSSVSKSTDVEEETLRGSFLTLGAARSGSGRRRPGGIIEQTLPWLSGRQFLVTFRVRVRALVSFNGNFSQASS